jgi:hypothetical protein
MHHKGGETIHSKPISIGDSGVESKRMILSTPIRPPHLRLVPCCSTCKHSRPEGYSVECNKYNTKGITLRAICDDYETA